MPFTALPEQARQAAVAEGTLTIHAVIEEYALNPQGDAPVARLNQALHGIREAAEATIAAEWPAVADEVGLVVQWSHWIAAAVYQFGAAEYPIEDHAGDELARAREIVELAVQLPGPLAAAQGALTALRARQDPHPDDPCDPARRETAGAP